MLLNFVAFVAAVSVATTALATPPSNESHYDRRTLTIKPVMGGINFPDPAMIRVGDNFYGYATQTMFLVKRIHVQTAQSIGDFEHWNYLPGKDALPKVPSWTADNPAVWAPDVVRLDTGDYVMYYSAATKANSHIHCLGVATSTSGPLGPFVPKSMSESPWVCNPSAGGAIDPAGYYDPADNTRWVVYKVDGNAVGHGGNCNNGIKPIVSTPIMLQQVHAGDGVTKIGPPIQLITNGPADGPVVEAPSLSRMVDGTYVLFFSSNCWATPLYDVSYATAKNIRGPYTKYGPMLVTGTMGLTAPGGLDMAINGIRAVFHANYNGGRAMFTAVVNGRGNLWQAYVKNT